MTHDLGLHFVFLCCTFCKITYANIKGKNRVYPLRELCLEIISLYLVGASVSWKVQWGQWGLWTCEVLDPCWFMLSCSRSVSIEAWWRAGRSSNKNSLVMELWSRTRQDQAAYSTMPVFPCVRLPEWSCEGWMQGMTMPEWIITTQRTHKANNMFARWEPSWEWPWNVINKVNQITFPTIFLNRFHRLQYNEALRTLLIACNWMPTL